MPTPSTSFRACLPSSAARSDSLPRSHGSSQWKPYVRAFRNVVFSRGKSDRYTWVNIEFDMVRFVELAINLEKLSEKDSTAIRHMIIHFSEIWVFFEGIADTLYRMKNLESLQMHVAYGGLGGWARHVGYLEARFEEWFGRKDDGWVCPEIRLIDLESGFEVNRENHRTHSGLAPWPSPRAPRPISPRARGTRGRGCRGSRGGRIARS
ncbi:hypothetical protein Micbo1qcDRAFT_173714 [Microdochium bolleyi]|uniref:Uncharacterized protein n=1 Tax=Microdochium bolleyi TaxID=196109 RepID=A0A136J5X4_9PEZI|nr:hypothetical protein Micbo1qcDRAFT_173714 [Microdochium bolleyi]